MIGIGRAVGGPAACSGIALVAKPAGVTSFQALGPLKRILGTTKLGHTGTLDSFASGLLVILVGRLTRLGSFFTAMDKRYVASVRFGEETATLDPEGEVVARAPLPTLAAIEAALPAFRGPLMQAPPAYSAVHIDGERASDRARRGESLVMKERPVTIHELELLAYEGGDAILSVRCSSGTYIRSLARDLAKASGSVARLDRLERTHVGPYSLEQARPTGQFSGPADLLPFDPSAAAGLGLSACGLARGREEAFRNGQPIVPAWLSPLGGGSEIPEPPLAIFSEAGNFLGVLGRTAGTLSYLMVVGAP
ncbi:MAG: tRNA pseudouridine(55) synthase TruB [Spirochaetota bacterium]